jgi:hypothetical protein
MCTGSGESHEYLLTCVMGRAGDDSASPPTMPIHRVLVVPCSYKFQINNFICSIYLPQTLAHIHHSSGYVR